MPDVVPANTDSYIACRHNCAYNFPAITAFCSTAEKIDIFSQQLHSTFRDLACDPYFMIRHTIACGLYEVMASLTFNLTIFSLNVTDLVAQVVEVSNIRYFRTFQQKFSMISGIGINLVCVISVTVVMYLHLL
jgi:hypothetical protein